MRNSQITNLLWKIDINNNDEKMLNKCDEEWSNNIHIDEEGVGDGLEYNDFCVFYFYTTLIWRQCCFFLQQHATFSVTLFVRFYIMIE